MAISSSDSRFIRASTVAALTIVSALILLYHDARQKPVPPAFDYARQALAAMGKAKANPAFLDQAFASLHEALRMDPKNPVALFGMGWALQSSGENEEAMRVYQRAIEELSILKAYSHYNMSFIKEDEANFKSAASHLDEARAAWPTLPGLDARREHLQRVISRAEQEISALANPSDGKALLNLGTDLINRGFESEGRYVLVRAMEIDPSLADVELHGLKTNGAQSHSSSTESQPQGASDAP